MTDYLRADFDPPSLTERFSNYSIYFMLQNNGINVNCSVYSLTQGNLAFLDYFTEIWNSNVTNFLPSYYITNCSVADVLTQVRLQNITSEEVARWMKEFRNNPYNISDNGDLFVALLFTFLGLCVLCWMLMLMHLLLPRHRRKPWLVLICTLVYSIVLTIILVRITQTTEAEYYKDSLDMVNIMAVLDQRGYPYALIILHFMIGLAYTQLLWKLIKDTWRWRSTVFALLLLVATLIISIVSVAVSAAPRGYGKAYVNASLRSSISLGIVFILWFCFCLSYYTFWAKPRLVSYTSRLLPIAILTWLMLLAREVICILLMTLWAGQWLVNSWLAYLPNMIDIIILTSTYEWLFLIEQVEQKIELSGMLGRRISIEDVKNFNNDWSKGAAGKRLPSILEWLHQKFNTKKNVEGKKNKTAGPGNGVSDVDNATEEVELRSLEPISSINGNVVALDEASVYELHHGGSDLWDSDSEESRSLAISENLQGGAEDVGNIIAFERDSPVQASSLVEQPPPFVPLPGTSAEDYWDDKR